MNSHAMVYAKPSFSFNTKDAWVGGGKKDEDSRPKDIDNKVTGYHEDLSLFRQQNSETNHTTITRVWMSFIQVKIPNYHSPWRNPPDLKKIREKSQLTAFTKSTENNCHFVVNDIIMLHSHLPSSTHATKPHQCLGTRSLSARHSASLENCHPGLAVSENALCFQREGGSLSVNFLGGTVITHL